MWKFWKMVASTGETTDVDYIKTGTVEQPILEKKGDNLRIDWGSLYIATPKSAKVTQNVSTAINAKTLVIFIPSLIVINN